MNGDSKSCALFSSLVVPFPLVAYLQPAVATLGAIPSVTFFYRYSGAKSGLDGLLTALQ